jgi:hypothetical protein
MSYNRNNYPWMTDDMFDSFTFYASRFESAIEKEVVNLILNNNISNYGFKSFNEIMNGSEISFDLPERNAK